MPIPRHLAIVVCSCGQRWGNAERAALHEDMMALEHGILASLVPKMIRHHALGHRFTLGENAPREFLATIAKAAERAAGKADGGAEPVPAARRLGAVED